VPICLRGDLVAEVEDFERQLAVVVAGPDDGRMVGTKLSEKRLAEAITALEEQMRESTVVFRLRALTPARWAALTAEHPPRKGEDGNVDDRDYIGVNKDTFFPELVRQSVVAPVLDDADWAILFGEVEPGPADGEDTDSGAGGHGLTDGQFDALCGAAWALNKRTVDVPFSLAASRILRKPEPE
jgi:hypothetical protein